VKLGIQIPAAIGAGLARAIRVNSVKRSSSCGCSYTVHCLNFPACVFKLASLSGWLMSSTLAEPS